MKMPKTTDAAAPITCARIRPMNEIHAERTLSAFFFFFFAGSSGGVGIMVAGAMIAGDRTNAAGRSAAALSPSGGASPLVIARGAKLASGMLLCSIAGARTADCPEAASEYRQFPWGFCAEARSGLLGNRGAARRQPEERGK